MTDKYEIIYQPKEDFWSDDWRYVVHVNGDRNGLSSDFLWKARWNIRRAMRKGKKRVIETWQG